MLVLVQSSRVAVDLNLHGGKKNSFIGIQLKGEEKKNTFNVSFSSLDVKAYHSSWQKCHSFNRDYP